MGSCKVIRKVAFSLQQNPAFFRSVVISLALGFTGFYTSGALFDGSASIGLSTIGSPVFTPSSFSCQSYSFNFKPFVNHVIRFKLETDFTYKFRHKDRIKSNCKETSKGDTRYSTLQSKCICKRKVYI